MKSDGDGWILFSICKKIFSNTPPIHRILDLSLYPPLEVFFTQNVVLSLPFGFYTISTNAHITHFKALCCV